MTANASVAEKIELRAETPFDAPAIERLVLAAFGPGRFAKTAERLREDARPAAGWVVIRDHGVVGSVRLWPIRVEATPALFLGPIAVDAVRRSAGLGAELVEAAAAHADAVGLPILLVGDTPYFGRFGFQRADEIVMPGPVDPARLLWRGPRAVQGRVRAV